MARRYVSGKAGSGASSYVKGYSEYNITKTEVTIKMKRGMVYEVKSDDKGKCYLKKSNGKKIYLCKVKNYYG